MRKVFLTLLFLVALTIAIGALWIFQGSKISMYVDRYGIAEISSEKVSSIDYHGSGSGGVLYANRTQLYLDSVIAPAQSPNIGSTKDGKLAIAVGGKVFPLGPLSPASDSDSENLTAVPDTGDQATVTIGHSHFYWPNPFEVNFMTGATPSWKRYTYQRLRWIKPNRSRLEMLWRYQQYYYRRDGWANPGMTREGETGLIRINITLPNG